MQKKSELYLLSLLVHFEPSEDDVQIFKDKNKVAHALANCYEGTVSWTNFTYFSMIYEYSSCSTIFVKYHSESTYYFSNILDKFGQKSLKFAYWKTKDKGQKRFLKDRLHSSPDPKQQKQNTVQNLPGFAPPILTLGRSKKSEAIPIGFILNSEGNLFGSNHTIFSTKICWKKWQSGTSRT